MNLQQLIYEHGLQLGDEVNCTIGCVAFPEGVYTIVINYGPVKSKMGIISDSEAWAGNYPDTEFEIKKKKESNDE